LRRRRFLALAAAFATLAARGQAPAAARTPLQSMRLATLGEHIAKLFFQVAQGVLAERSRRGLAQSVREFDAALRATLASPARDEAREGFLLLRLLWDEYRGWAAKPATRENARALAERADEVAWVAARTAPLVGRTRPLALDAARAGVLAQRVARLHLMRRWEPRDAVLERRLAASARELRQAVARLAREADTDAAVVAELQVAENQLAFLEQAAQDVAHGGARASAYEVIAKAGDHLLEALERAARLLDTAVG
jgi:hypothetical protein